MNHWVQLLCACHLFPGYRDECSSESESGELVDPQPPRLGRADVVDALMVLHAFPDAPKGGDVTLIVNATDPPVQQ